MLFRKTTEVGKDYQTDTYLLEIPFSDLPEWATEQIIYNCIECPEILIDIQNQVILISEGVTH